MHINLISKQNIFSLFKEKIIPTLTDRQKKIIAIALIAFSFIALCYAMCCFKKIEMTARKMI